MIFFPGSPAALIALSLRMRHDPSWRGLAPYTLGSGLVLLALALVGMVVVRPDAAPLHVWAGLHQRIMSSRCSSHAGLLSAYGYSRSREPLMGSPAPGRWHADRAATFLESGQRDRPPTRVGYDFRASWNSAGLGSDGVEIELAVLDPPWRPSENYCTTATAELTNGLRLAAPDRLGRPSTVRGKLRGSWAEQT